VICSIHLIIRFCMNIKIKNFKILFHVYLNCTLSKQPSTNTSIPNHSFCRFISFFFHIYIYTLPFNCSIMKYVSFIVVIFLLRHTKLSLLVAAMLYVLHKDISMYFVSILGMKLFTAVEKQILLSKWFYFPPPNDWLEELD